MDDRYDKEKLHRDKEENEFMDVFWIKDVAETIVADLVQWSNDEIYSRLGGELRCVLPLSEEVNARAFVDPGDPYNPRIELYMGMVREIYRDSFVFPVLADKIASGPDYIDHLKAEFSDVASFFDGGVPSIPASQHTNIYKSIKNKIVKERVHPGIPENALACRFLMFEVMLAWVFFHELSHLVQRHYLLRSGSETPEALEAESYEMTKVECVGEECVRFQAREVLADVEGGEFTVRYLLRKKMFHFSSVYLLLCAQYCMFNRFYKGYESNLEFVNARHPHPVVRNELTSQFVTEYVVFCLVNMQGSISRSEIVRAVAYLDVKSSLLSGLYWGNRYEKMDGSLTSFMSLSIGEHTEKRNEYCAVLRRAMFEQLEVIKENHMHRHNFTDFIGVLNFFNRATKENK
ncbi:hypothetical protein ACI2KG_10290 [Pseudomonas sp. NPDC089407]|uniref:hypothetical protein n=1 Tax=Pseudomonas sp. NPDC089407 TaxID=3364464 RepID=UPI00385143CC